jgi:alpha-glucosidase (family GH31 glycosyl hydrolase)
MTADTYVTFFLFFFFAHGGSPLVLNDTASAGAVQSARFDAVRSAPALELLAPVDEVGVALAAQQDIKPIESGEVRYGGVAAELTVSRVSERTIEILLSPVGGDGRALQPPPSEVLVPYTREVLWSGRTLGEPLERKVGNLTLRIQPSPLTVAVARADGTLVQSLMWPAGDGAMHFRTDAPVFGLGHGGPQFDRRGHRLPMTDGWGAYERPTHGSRVSAPMLIGADGWSMFVHHPIDSANVFDLRDGRGIFEPSKEARQAALKLLLTAWEEPVQAMSEYRLVAGATPLPPLWALGYMQSHRTLEGPEQIIRVARTFRDKQLPIDAVIYLGTGFTPLGWNRDNRTIEWNPLAFDDPPRILGDLRRLNLKVALHTYTPPPGLYGSSADPAGVDPADEAHLANYWKLHVPVFETGVDAWWPDGGERNPPESRVARHRLYRLGPLYTRPNERPWSFHRTGYSGAHRYGGFIWSGDPDSYWETLKTQIAVGLNHVVSLTPFWGSDTGGFLPSKELTGELYVRWFQFSTFCTSFRSHGRAWHLRLPWGWNTGQLGPPEVDQFSDAFAKGYPDPAELRNGLVEPIARQYLHLRYQLLSYNYTLVRETHDTGMPPMRAMWLHYPDEAEAVRRADQFMWGRDLLVAPVYEKGATARTLYLPAGDWYDFWTGERVAGGREISRQVDLATMPIYVRAGAILPIDPVRQHTGEAVDGPVTFRVYPGRDGEYRWYRDDGRTLDYERGAYSWTRLRWHDAAGRLVVEADEEGGGAVRPAGGIRAVLMPSQRLLQ